MSKLSILKKDLRMSSQLSKSQSLKLKGGDDKRADRPTSGASPGVTSTLAAVVNSLLP